VSATVSGGFGAFSASAKFSYSDQWQNSARSGRAYFNISSIWTLDNTVDSENPLTEQGANAGDQLATLCGVRYMGSVPAGMVATIAVAYGTNSETAKRNIDASFSVSDAGLGSLKAAVDASNATSDTSSHFKVQLNHIGGGTEATTELTTSFGAGNSDGPYYDQCGKGDADACATFIGNMTTAAINAGNDFNQRAQSIEAGEDLSFFTPFPNGAAGVDTTQLVTEPASTDDDVLAPYQDQLEQYMTLVNEIATLDNRAKHLSTLIAETPSFNPSNILDLQNYLGPLVDENPGAISYAASKTILLDDLSNCLNATSSDVTEVCSSIIEGGETVASAYDFYDAEHGYPDCTNATSSDDVADCWLAQQNTIALQYAATYDNGRHSWPEDVIYADVFPTFTASPPPFGSGVPISGKAGLIPFTDATFFDSGPGDPAKEQEFAVVNILPLKNDVDLSAIYESTDPSMLAFNIFGFDDDPTSPPVWSSSNLPFTWTSPICEPSFSAPCAIGYQLRAADETITVSINQVSDLFTAD
jgi:hypothetical protein